MYVINYDSTYSKSDFPSTSFTHVLHISFRGFTYACSTVFIVFAWSDSLSMRKSPNTSSKNGTKADELVSLWLPLYIPGLPVPRTNFSTGQIIPYQQYMFRRFLCIFQTAPSGHDFNGVRSTSRAAYAEDGGNWKNPWEKTKKKTENASILQLISFQRKTGQKMDYISFQQLFEHLTTNQIDFRSSKSTFQLKLTWKTEPFSAVRNAKPETQPGSQTCDVKMMLRIGIFAKAAKWQWFFSGVFGTCCRSKELMMSLVNSASKTTLGRE